MKIKLNAFKVTQQIGDFFVAKIRAEDLVYLTYSDIRELQDERDVETYLGIQRPLDKKRSKEIQEYVKNYDATFPGNIILHLDEDFIKWDEESNTLCFDFPDDNSPAKILDGQHRVAGFMDLNSGEPIKDVCSFIQGGELKAFELMITVFVGLDLPEQASIFSIVNLKQTKVSKSLVYDLEAYTNIRSPQKTAHDIVIALDLNVKSPFYGRVKRLGFKNDVYENLTQARLVEEFVKLISNEPMKDRDILLPKEKKVFSKFRTEELASYPLEKGMVFRDMFIEGVDDSILITTISFFKVIERKWPNSWHINTQESSLNKAVGVKALFRVLRDIVKNKFTEGGSRLEPIKVDYFEKKLMGINISDEYFLNLEATSVSEGKIYNKIKDCL